MKTLVQAFLLLLAAAGAHAQVQQLDVLSYQPPAGPWSEKRGRDFVLYTLIDSSRGSFAQFALYVSRESSGDAAADFEAEWRDLVEKTGTVDERPVPAARDAGQGWRVLRGEAQVTGPSGQYTSLLTVYVGGGRVTSVLANYSDPSHLPELRTLLAGVQPTGTAVAAAAGPEAASTGSVSAAGAGPRAELWMGLKAGAWNQSGSGGFYDLAGIRAEWKVVYPDGEYYPYLPSQGLLDFDRAKSRADANEGPSWGRFTFSGGRGRFQSRFEDVRVEASGPTVLMKSGSVFRLYRSVDVTGLRPQGSWSSIPRSETDPYYGEQGCRPVIHFDRSGRFDDRGIFVGDCRYPERYPEDAPGTGRYRIQDFTLVLEYADGRRRLVAFCGVMDKNPAVVDQVLYIGGNPFFKRPD